MAAETKSIGVDLGGTKVVAGRLSGITVEKTSYQLVKKDAQFAEEIITQIIEVIENVYDPYVLEIGIGVPSLVDRKKGIVYNVQNIPSWKKVYLKNALESHFHVPVELDNDANCFALGESVYENDSSHGTFVGLTIGTGIGAGIITDGHLLNDANCGSGEFGSIPYQDGIYEDYCSGQFFTRFYGRTGKEIFNLAENNDPEALNAFSEFGNHLGNLIKTIMFSVDPKKIIIGGSISRSKKYFETAMLKRIADFPYPESVENLEIHFSDHKNVAILGAASLFRNGKTLKTS